MNKEEIKKVLRKLLSETLSIEESSIKDESHFVSDLQADSLDAVEITMEVEDEFNIQIRDEEVALAPTFRSMVSLIESKLPQ